MHLFTVGQIMLHLSMKQFENKNNRNNKPLLTTMTFLIYDFVNGLRLFCLPFSSLAKKLEKEGVLWLGVNENFIYWLLYSNSLTFIFTLGFTNCVFLKSSKGISKINYRTKPFNLVFFVWITSKLMALKTFILKICELKFWSEALSMNNYVTTETDLL